MILFVSNRDGQDHLYLMNDDGTGVTRITNTASQDDWPSWSPDGSRIVFRRAFNGTGIYTANGDGSNQVRVSPTPGFDVAPTYNNDGTKIIFSFVPVPPPPDPPPTDIMIMNADGTGRQLILASGGFVNTEPRMSPDGTKIVFMSNRAGGQHIFVMNSDGSGVTQLTTQGANGDPFWSPDGAKISFGSNREGGGKLNVYTMLANGTNQRKQTFFHLPFESGDTSWSPDGSKIVFELDWPASGQSNPNAHAEVWVVNSDGSGRGLRSLHQSCSAVGCSPKWRPWSLPLPAAHPDGAASAAALAGARPDSAMPIGRRRPPQPRPKPPGRGQMLVFPDRDPHDNSLNLFVINEDGTGRRQLTFGKDNGTPSWSPDGRYLVYCSRDPATELTAIRVMDFESGNAHTIGLGNTPEWSLDGQLIAFSDTGPGSTFSNLWVMRPDGGGHRQVTFGTTVARIRPTWSADNTEIAWAEFDAIVPPVGHVQIWRSPIAMWAPFQCTFVTGNVNVDSNGNFINLAQDANSPTWRHRKIACWSGVETQNGQVWSMEGDGSSRIQLTHNPAASHNDDPTRCPDERIIYSSDAGGMIGMWIMNPDGSGQRRICNSSAGPFPGYGAMRPAPI